MTIDAMGCQREIAQQIIEQGRDYVLAVKGNQRKLHAAIQEFFAEQMEDDSESIPSRRYESHEKGHGRVDDRYHYLAKLSKDFPEQGKWVGLNAIGMAVRITTDANGKETFDTRYYIASRYLSGEKFAAAVRGHWGIENSLHWQLDVTFGEDRSRVRKGYADANASLLRRTVLALLKNHKKTKLDVKTND